MSTEENLSSKTQADPPVFKKPVLIGKVGKFPKKVIKDSNEQNVEVISKLEEEITDTSEADSEKSVETEETSKLENVEEKEIPLSYKVPPWSGVPELENRKYKFEVLKSGSIIQTIDLMEKPYWIFGRLRNCDICTAHPTISRYHAVLQYRNIESDDQPKGFYLYDLSSTHGTFLNKNRIKPRTYVKVYVGHLLKLGLSSRSYLLVGPEDDTEQESEFTITQLKQKRQELLASREEAEKEAIKKRQDDQEAIQKKHEERGIDWGLGEDADEETDLSENPFAQTNNEELYLDDPKKALRGFMEREGHDLEYDCSEQGMGQFLCKVELPLDDERGRPIVAEVLHKGKKKEAVVQCALEACRILDRYGLLRQATHESRKRKAKNWEENDFYDSDEDTFLDRTGTIEKKRENRMKAKAPTQPETYQGLLEKEFSLRNEIDTIEKQLANSNKTSVIVTTRNEEDSLDHYMKELKQMKLDKQTISKLKSDLSKLKQDLVNVVKLANIAKPTSLPTLIQENPKHPKNSSSSTKLQNKLPIFGKRLKVKVQMPARKENIVMDADDDEEEIEENDNVKDNLQKEKPPKTPMQYNFPKPIAVPEEKTFTPTSKFKGKNNIIDPNQKFLTDCLKIDTSFKMLFPLMSNESEKYLKDIWTEMKSLHPDYSESQQIVIANIFSDYINSCKYITVVDTFTNEIDLMKDKLKSLSTSNEIIEIGRKLINLVKEITLMANRLDQNDETDEATEKPIDDDGELDTEKKRKKNQRRIQQRQEKAEIEKQKGYKEDASKEDYNMWLPPKGQTGDGRTSLNEKFGY